MRAHICQNVNEQTPLQIAVNMRDRAQRLFCRFFSDCIAYIDSDENVRDNILGSNAQYWFEEYVRQTAIVSLFRDPVRPVITNDSNEEIFLIDPNMMNINLALEVWVRDPFYIISSDINYPDNIWQIFLHRIANDTSIDLTVRQFGGNLLHSAVGYRRFRVVELLVDRGMDVNEPNSRGRTGLQLVTRSMNSNKDTICRAIEVPSSLCTDEYVRQPTLTDRQMAIWGYRIGELSRNYLVDYDMVELLKSKGAEEVEVEP